jgi:hypothetical protein
MKYTSKPITPVEAVLWKGDNIIEVKTVCPEAEEAWPDTPDTGPYMLILPSGISVNVGEYVTMHAPGIYSKMGAEIFAVLYKEQ